MSELLTPKQDAFARFYVETGNASEAYRRAYDVGAETKPETIWQEASRTLANPAVAARVMELQDEARARTMVTVEGLTAKEEAFAVAYVETGNGADAYRRAYAVGETTKPETVWSEASRVLARPHVAERVMLLQSEIAEKAVVDVARTVTELARIGFSDVREAFDEDGGLRRPKDWTDEFAAAVASMEVVTRKVGEGEIEHVAKVKLWDKNSALEKIARHLGMFVDRVEHGGTIGIASAGRTDLDRAKAIASILLRGGAQLQSLFPPRNADAVRALAALQRYGEEMERKAQDKETHHVE